MHTVYLPKGPDLGSKHVNRMHLRYSRRSFFPGASAPRAAISYACTAYSGSRPSRSSSQTDLRLILTRASFASRVT